MYPSPLFRERITSSQRDTITHQPNATILVFAAMGIINSVSIANIETALAAVFPDRVLDEPGEDPWKRGVELPGIDVFGDDLKNVGTAAGTVASQPVKVVRVEPGQDAGAM